MGAACASEDVADRSLPMVTTRSVRQPALALALGLALGCAVVAGGWRILAAQRAPAPVAFHHVAFDAESGLGVPADEVTPADLGASALAARSPRFPPSAFRRRPLTPAELAKLQPERDLRNAPDPNAYFVYRPRVDLEFPWPEHPRGAWRQRTNALGFRDDGDLAASRPDLRVLVAGDSHTDGVCDNHESFANLLEAELARRDPTRTIEVLNAGHGSYSFYHYLGTLERNAWLAPDVLVVAIYGGNDFEEGLTLYHLFEGTQRPAGTSAYYELFSRAKEVSVPALAQSFISLKYFAHNPGEVEVALQMARDVASEIDVTCRRLGVHPIFVYIPPLADAQRDRCRDLVEGLAAALELEPGDLDLHDRMADVFLEHLRQRRIDVLDLRPSFRAAEDSLYWTKDHHIALSAHRRIAAALVPLVESASVASGERVRSGASRPLAFDEQVSLFSPGAPRASDIVVFCDWIAGEPLAEVAAVPLGALKPYDPARAPALEVSAPVGADADVRALLVGDERTCGTVSSDGEPLARLVERELARIGASSGDCVAASATGAGFDAYVAGIDALLALDPEVLVLFVDGDDDWIELIRGRGSRERADVETAHPYLAWVARIARGPREAGRTLHFAVEATIEIRGRCDGAGARLVVVHVPSPFQIATTHAMARARAEIEALELGDEAFATASRVSARYAAEIRGRGIELIDATPVLERRPDGGFDADLALEPSAREILASLVARRIHLPRTTAAREHGDDRRR